MRRGNRLASACALLAGVGLLAGALWSAPAAARSGCGSVLPPSNLQLLDIRTVHVTVTVAPRASIEQVAVLTAHPLMAIETDVASWFRVDHRVVGGAGDVYCAAPTEVRFGLGHSRRQVHLIPEAAGDLCVRDVLLAHEADHNQADEALLTALLKQEESFLGAGFNALKHTPMKDADEAAAGFEAAGQAIVEEVTERFRIAKRRLWQQMDSPAELARLRQACSGKVGRLEAISGEGT